MSEVDQFTERKYNVSKESINFCIPMTFCCVVLPDGFSWFCLAFFHGFAVFVEEFTTVLRKGLAPPNSWVCGLGACIKLRTAPLWRVSSARASLAASETVGDSPEAVPVS